jgi:hypothetical protein
MRLAGFTFFTLAAIVLSLVDGTAASMVAFVLWSIGGGLIARKQLDEWARRQVADDRISVRVVRWNY